ncbi:ribosome biogenesis protein SLX9-domain-containing protein [Paraphysoderma sedebokerense]|nr:ribosome biogenesis protein SLX9-domain-containing protein [Paraphysoderma sedebokerense]
MPKLTQPKKSRIHAPAARIVSSNSSGLPDEQSSTHSSSLFNLPDIQNYISSIPVSSVDHTNIGVPDDLSNDSLPFFVDSKGTVEKDRFGRDKPRNKKLKRLEKHKEFLKKLSVQKPTLPTPPKPLLSLKDDFTGVLESMNDPTDVENVIKKAELEEKEAKNKMRMERVSTRKGRKKKTEVEAARFQQVLKHPTFLSDPFAAIQQHLSNTVGKK